MLKYTRNMQKGIYALIHDLSESDLFNCSPVLAESILKKMYWGDREGEFSLSLDKCLPHNARGFYRFLLEIALSNQIDFCTWASPKCPPRSPLDWGFDKVDIFELCVSLNVDPFNFKNVMEVLNYEK